MSKAASELGPVNWKEFTPAPVIGVDEVGRGCLAGAVFAGAVILKSDIGVSEMTDSKLLSEKQRDELSELIIQNHQVSLAIATVEEIDEINILKASWLAMRRAVEGLITEAQLVGGHILVDGPFKIPDLKGIVQTPLIKGDLRAAPVSAAAICAKVARDRYMKELAKEYPGYGLEKHKGYSTKLHKEAIARLGPAIIHRKTFAGVKEFIL